MSDLVAWLREQLDEDERVARAVAHQRWECDRDRVVAPLPDDVLPDIVADGALYGDMHESMPEATARHIARHDPKQVLAEVESKRRILDLHGAEPGQHPDFCWHDKRELPCPTLRLLALPYADRPGYDPAWGER